MRRIKNTSVTNETRIRSADATVHLAGSARTDFVPREGRATMNRYKSAKRSPAENLPFFSLPFYRSRPGVANRRSTVRRVGQYGKFERHRGGKNRAIVENKVIRASNVGETGVVRTCTHTLLPTDKLRCTSSNFAVSSIT